MKNEIINIESFKKYTIEFLSRLKNDYIGKFDNYLKNIGKYVAEQNLKSFKSLKEEGLDKIFEKFNIKIKKDFLTVQSYQKFILKML